MRKNKGDWLGFWGGVDRMGIKNNTPLKGMGGLHGEGGSKFEMPQIYGRGLDPHPPLHMPDKNRFRMCAFARFV